MLTTGRRSVPGCIVFAERELEDAGGKCCHEQSGITKHPWLPIPHLELFANPIPFDGGWSSIGTYLFLTGMLLTTESFFFCVLFFFPAGRMVSHMIACVLSMVDGHLLTQNLISSVSKLLRVEIRQASCSLSLLVEAGTEQEGRSSAVDMVEKTNSSRQ